MMRRTKLTLFLLRLMALFALSVSAVQAEAAINKSSDKISSKTSPAISVSYDRVSDQLSITADKASLKSVLGRIARKSGIEVLFDDLADESVNIDIQSQSLESGLKGMLQGRNYMLRYSRDEQQRLLLIGVMVLPVGEQETGRAKRLVAIDDEAFYRAMSQLSLEQVQKIDLAKERWQARYDELTPEQHEKIEKKVAARMLKQAQREQERAEKAKRRKQISEADKARRQQQHELALQGLDKEQRAARDQSGDEARESVRVILQQEQR